MDLPETLCLTVSVGFEYESCLDLILWEKRTAILQGYELDASNVGGWTLDKHHILDVQNGRLYIIFSVTELDTAICDNTAKENSPTNINVVHAGFSQASREIICWNLESLTLPFLLAPHQSDLIICNEGSGCAGCRLSMLLSRPQH